MRVAYAIFVLTYGLALLVAAFAWHMIPIPFLQSANGMGTTFAISVLLAVPFVVTYTRLGLNTAEGEHTSPETKARHSELYRECPAWPICWYGGLGFVGFALVGSTFLQIPIHPFFAFSATFSCLTGFWFLFAYPVALRLFDS